MCVNVLNDSDTLDRDILRANFLRYTRKAFRMLPLLPRPRILDIGCGTGIPTLELASISDGLLVAVDIDRDALGKLVDRAKSKGFSGKITAVHASMLNMGFSPGSFDIIWTEGAISCIGFERGLAEWRSLTVPDGYLVVHDSMSDLKRKIELIRACGYTMLGKFELPADIWWEKYYTPLKRAVDKLRQVHPVNENVIADIKEAEREIKQFDRDSCLYSSVFMIMQKT